ncbi:MAG: DMT family transporter [Cyanobacteria bacterium P01_H01_bin.15]
MIKRPPQWKLLSILCVGVFSVSTAAIFVRLAIANAETPPGLAFSLFLAAGRLLISALFVLPAWRNVARDACDRKSIYWAIAAGLCLAAHFVLWIASLMFTSITVSTVLVTTNPLWVGLFGALGWGERPNRLTWLGIGIAIGSSFLIAIDNTGVAGSQPLLGSLLATLAAILVSFYLLCSRSAQIRGLSLSSLIVIAYSTAALALFPLPFLWGQGYGGYPWIVYGCVAGLAIISQVIGHTSFNWAVCWLSPTLLTLTILIEPLGASLLGWWIFAEIPTAQTVFAGLGILLGVAIAGTSLPAQSMQNSE